MKLIAKIVIFSLCIANVHAELLIIKHVQPQTAASSSSSSRTSQPSIAPLDESDERNYHAIAQVLLNYQWPMVIANPNLTPAEQNALLTPGIENAEENFIRRKLQKINSAYDVAFIPTCLYEMFIIDIADKKEIDPLKNVINSFGMISRKINILNEINGNGSLHNPWQDVYNTFNIRNSSFYENAFFYCNNRIVQNLCTQHSRIQTASAGIEMSNVIESLIGSIGYTVAVDILKNYKTIYNSYQIFYKQIALLENNMHYHQAVHQIIAFEYEMRKSNKGLLLRGSNEITLTRENQKYNVPVMGSLISEMNIFDNMQKSYKEKSNLPYSVSFGNSLFAGFFNDKTACVANYISQTVNYGYGLTINKKEYIQNRSSSLFFISPLAPIAGLFAAGEFFHSRTKICIPKKIINTSNQVQGFAIKPSDIIDPDHIITTTNDPLVNAELFSNYLTKNMHVFSVGHEELYPILDSHLKKHINKSDLGLTPAEQTAFYEKMQERSNNFKTHQKQAADYYKATRKLAQHLPVATANFQKRENKNVGQQMRNLRFNKDMQKIEDEKLMNDTQKFMDNID